MRTMNRLLGVVGAMLWLGCVSAEELVWIDGRDLPLEGKAFTATKNFYDRMPASLEGQGAINPGVWAHSHHTAGFCFRFKTNATTLRFQWNLLTYGMPATHMPATGESGVDVYGWTDGVGWQFIRNGRPQRKDGNELVIEGWRPGRAVLVYLPLYNGVTSFRLGIPKGCTVEPLPPRKSGIVKPVVFYGTSITQGGCASRPGMAWVNIVGRRLDVPVVNLGFSGSGRMELEMAAYLADVDASCYVLDCLWNMGDGDVQSRFEPFVRELRRRRPNVPIVCAEDCGTFRRTPSGKGLFVQGVVDRLKREGWRQIFFLPNTEQMTGDHEETVDTIHPNDWGMMHVADGFVRIIRKTLAR